MSTISTKRVFYQIIFSFFNKIPQFDILTLGAQIFGLLISLCFYYYFSITTTIPYYVEIKKFRIKKLNKNMEFVNNVKKDLENTLWHINYTYKKIL